MERRRPGGWSGGVPPPQGVETTPVQPAWTPAFPPSVVQATDRFKIDVAACRNDSPGPRMSELVRATSATDTIAVGGLTQIGAFHGVNDEISAKFAEIQRCMMKSQRNSLDSSDA